mmetsp:Transcript_44932/g.126883  ORF Transcript_44932/g.126883 Transcript_44932/m.126883 type:complete len:226 (-) Transcript_44932:134-811(-)
MAGSEGRVEDQPEAGLDGPPHLTVGTAQETQAAAVPEPHMAADHHELRQHTGKRHVHRLAPVCVDVVCREAERQRAAVALAGPLQHLSHLLPALLQQVDHLEGTVQVTDGEGQDTPQAETDQLLLYVLLEALEHLVHFRPIKLADLCRQCRSLRLINRHGRVGGLLDGGCLQKADGGRSRGLLRGGLLSGGMVTVRLGRHRSVTGMLAMNRQPFLVQQVRRGGTA